MYQAFSENDTAARLKETTRGYSLLSAGDAAAMLHQLDRHLYAGLEQACRLFPRYSWNVFSGMAVSVMGGKRKITTYGYPVHSKVLRVLAVDPSSDVHGFVEAVREAKVVRGFIYAFLADVANDVSRYSAFNAFEFRCKYLVPRFPLGESVRIVTELEHARSLLEELEKPFHKKAIASAVSFARGDSDEAADYFMEAADAVRRAILRFDYMNDIAILATSVEQETNISVSMHVKAPVELPANAWEKYGKLKGGIEKGLSRDESAKAAGLMEDRARALENIFEGGADYRIDQESNKGIEDEDAEVPGELRVDFDFQSGTPLTEYVSRVPDDMDRLIVCLSFGIYEPLESSLCGPGPEDVEMESKRQLSQKTLLQK